MAQITDLMAVVERGDAAAVDQFLPLVYGELRKLAAARLAVEDPGVTLQATALVHEVYLRLVGGSDPVQFNGRGHFLAVAAEAMRRILVDAARKRRSLKRGGDRQRFDLSQQEPIALPVDDDLLDLHDALTKLQSIDSEASEVAKLRVFAGMTVEEVAAHLEISPRTVKRNWSFALAWLGRELDA